MNTAKTTLLALTLPFLTISFMAIGMDTKALIKMEFNQIMEKPFDHDKYQPKPHIRHKRIINGTYINYITQDTPQTTPNVLEVAKQQILNEKEEITKTLRQYTPEDASELNDIDAQISQSNNRLRNIKESAIALQKKLNEAASKEKILSIKSAAQEVITSPFNHDKYKTTIKLTSPACIGYGDTDYINHLNSINIPAKQDDPLVTVKFRTEPNLQAIVDHQIIEDVLKVKKILNQLGPDTMETYKLRREQLGELNKRHEKIYASANALWETSQLPWPPAIPAKYLDENCTMLELKGNKPVAVTFNENKKLTDLLTKFKEKPISLFCTLSEELATQIVFTNQEASPEIHQIIETEFLKQVNIKKEEFKTKKLIKRRPRQDDDLQEFEPTILQNSNLIEHKCNYHEHSKNGYTDKKRRNELIAGLNGNVIEFLKDRENGYKKRKLSSTAHNLS